MLSINTYFVMTIKLEIFFSEKLLYEKSNPNAAASSDLVLSAELFLLPLDNHAQLPLPSEVFPGRPPGCRVLGSPRVSTVQKTIWHSSNKVLGNKFKCSTYPAYRI